MTEQEQPMADTARTDSAWKWLYRGLAMTGIAVGIFIIAAGLYLLFAPPSWYTARTAQTHGCASMEADMKKMKADMEDMMKGMHGGMPNMPSTSPMPSTSMSPMPGMPSMSPMPSTSMSPMPNMPTPPR